MTELSTSDAWRRRVLALACVGLAASAPAAAASVKASSELTDRDGEVHRAALAFDGQLLTGWAEGEMGVGDGAWLELTFDRPTQVSTVSIWAGDLRKGERSMKEHGMPKLVTVSMTTTDGEELYQQVAVPSAERGISRVDVYLEGETRAVQITIDEGEAGFLHNDTYISEVAVNFVQGDPPAAQARLDAWVATPSAERAAARHRDEVIGLFDTIDQSEFGDRDALRTLMDWATDGAPWLADRVRREIPYGFRLGALPADPVAVEALLKLRDANAIPALRMAAQRTRGREARELLAKVSYFEAWAELNGGARRSLDTWGETGWEVGALKGLGEPLGIDLGVFGDLYVADTANHRVSIFKQDGTTRGTWGLGQANVTNTWFSGTRDFYVAGREASTKAGGFTNPVDVEVVSKGDSERVAVLDAEGRVTWLSAEGVVEDVWRVRHETPISPRVGGEGHLLWVKGKLVVVYGNEVVAFDDEGTEVSRFTIAEGVPMTAEALRNGKIILGFQREGVLYGVDGFRHGTVLQDVLPAGFEAWDLGSDEKGKLWIVTDNGLALKLKNPKKVDFQVTWVDYGVDVPRFDVFDGMLYITAGDRIHRVDALELRRKAEVEASEE